MTLPETVAEERDELGEPETPRCGGTRHDGAPCGVPAAILRQDEHGEWWCMGHDPDPVMRQRHALGTQRGGQTSKRRLSRYLGEDELGQLETAEDAARWSRIVGLAIASGRITPSAGRAILLSVKHWLASHDQTIRENELADLKREVERLKRGVR
jgi:hypothetical protein